MFSGHGFHLGMPLQKKPFQQKVRYNLVRLWMKCLLHSFLKTVVQRVTTTLVIKNAVCCIQGYKDEYRGSEYSELCRKSSRKRFYPKLHNALDWQLHMLRKNVIGVQHESAQIIIPDISLSYGGREFLV